jgi:hypothetical protein
VFSFDGRLMLQEKIKDDLFVLEFNTSSLSSGAYILKITNATLNNSSEYFRVIKL